MGSFKGSNKIILLEGDHAVPYGFEITVCTSLTANNGFIPYNTNAINVNAEAFTEDGTNVTSYMIDGTANVSLNVVYISLNYPTITGPGRYELVLELTLDNGSIVHAVFDRIFAEDTLSV